MNMKTSISRTLTTTLCAGLTGLLLSSTAIAQTIFVQDAKVVTNTTEGTMDNVSVIITNGRISQMGAGLAAPDGAQVLNAAGQWVTPGLFAPFASIGLVEISGESATNDSRASEGATSVSDMAADSFNPNSPVIGITRAEGITHAAISASASHNIFGGTGSIVSTTGGYDSVIEDQAFVMVELGERGARIAGGSRSASMSQLRAAIEDALAYPRRYSGPQDGDALSRRDAAALAKAARGQMPILIFADRAVDILKIIELKQDFGGLDIIVMGAAEGWMVADQIAAAYLKVVIDPHDNLPSSFDNVGARLDNAVLLKEAGVEFAFSTKTTGFSHNIRLLPQHAGNAVGNGLDWDTAFRAISTVPASWFDVDTGTLKSGAAATLVVWDGDPLEVTSSPTFMMIDGEVQSLESRQSLLRDRYNPSSDQTGPHKYR